jgi:hypothetical protein
MKTPAGAKAPASFVGYFLGMNPPAPSVFARERT